MREFSGSKRTVAGYLLAEVLERQPPEVRGLLPRTSVLERVSGPLADALTGGAGTERILQALEDANAFVTALDVGRSWYRYPHRSRTCCASSCDGYTRRSSIRCTGPLRPGSSSTGTSSRRSTTPRRRGIGDMRRAC